MSVLLDLATVEASFFESLLHEKFTTQLWNEQREPVALDFELIRVVPYHQPGQPGRRTPFSLFFQGAPGAGLEQNVYPLFHARTGELELFLVPVAQHGDQLEFEAALN